MSVFAKEIKAWLSAYTEAQKPPMDETKLKHLCAAIHHFNQIPKERLERLITIIKIRTRGNYSLSDQDSLKLELIIKALKKEELDIDASDIILISHLYVMVDDRFGASNKLSENEIFIDLVENALDFAIQHKLTESVNIILTNQFLNALFIDSEHSNRLCGFLAQKIQSAADPIDLEFLLNLKIPTLTLLYLSNRFFEDKYLQFVKSKNINMMILLENKFDSKTIFIRNNFSLEDKFFLLKHFNRNKKNGEPHNFFHLELEVANIAKKINADYFNYEDNKTLSEPIEFLRYLLNNGQKPSKESLEKSFGTFFSGFANIQREPLAILSSLVKKTPSLIKMFPKPTKAEQEMGFGYSVFYNEFILIHLLHLASHRFGLEGSYTNNKMNLKLDLHGSHVSTMIDELKRSFLGFQNSKSHNDIVQKVKAHHFESLEDKTFQETVHQIHTDIQDIIEKPGPSQIKSKSAPGQLLAIPTVLNSRNSSDTHGIAVIFIDDICLIADRAEEDNAGIGIYAIKNLDKKEEIANLLSRSIRHQNKESLIPADQFRKVISTELQLTKITHIDLSNQKSGTCAWASCAKMFLLSIAYMRFFSAAFQLNSLQKTTMEEKVKLAHKIAFEASAVFYKHWSTYDRINFAKEYFAQIQENPVASKDIDQYLKDIIPLVYIKNHARAPRVSLLEFIKKEYGDKPYLFSGTHLLNAKKTLLKEFTGRLSNQIGNKPILGLEKDNFIAQFSELWLITYLASKEDEKTLLKALKKAISENKDLKDILKSQSEKIMGMVQSPQLTEEIAVEILALAIKQRILPVIRILLQRFPSIVNHKNISSHTAIGTAIIHDHFDIVKILAEAKADINIANPVGLTPLHLAAEYGRTSMIDYLIEKGASINAQNISGGTPLFNAIQAQHFATAKALLLKKADPNIALTHCRTTPLHRATIDNQLELASLLIQFNAHVDTETKEGWTALHFASEHGYIALVKLLLDSKASGKKNSQNGSNVLNMAVGNHRISIVKLLLERGFSVHDLNRKGYSYLHIAAENGLIDIIQLLLQHGANPDLVCNNKLAIDFASSPQVRTLLQEATMSKKPILNQFPISVANAPNIGMPSSVTMTSTNNSKQNN